MRRGYFSLIGVAVLLIAMAMMPMSALGAQHTSRAHQSLPAGMISGDDGDASPINPLGGGGGGELPGVNAGDDDDPGETIIYEGPIKGDLGLSVEFKLMIMIWLQQWTLFGF
jgi:hypothetical protein